MLNVEISYSMRLNDPEDLAAIRALSPADGLIAVVKGIRQIFRTKRPHIAGELIVARQVAEAAIKQGLILVLPPFDIRREITEAALDCDSASTLAREICHIYKRRDEQRPPLRDVKAIAEAMITSGKAVLGDPKIIAANRMVDEIAKGRVDKAIALLKGRIFEDDFDACEGVINIVEPLCDAYPATAKTRACVIALAKAGIIAVTDSAMIEQFKFEPIAPGPSLAVDLARILIALQAMGEFTNICTEDEIYRTFHCTVNPDNNLLEYAQVRTYDSHHSSLRLIFLIEAVLQDMGYKKAPLPASRMRDIINPIPASCFSQHERMGILEEIQPALERHDLRLQHT